MGGVERLRDDLSRYQAVAIDTMIFIYVLEKNPIYFSLAKTILEIVEAGLVEGVISVITLTELLTAPAQEKDVEAMREYEMYLLNFPHLTVLPVNVEIARAAAHVRGDIGLPAPDAIILATAQNVQVDAIVTNDKRWRHKISGTEVVLLEDYLPDEYESVVGPEA